MRSILTLLMLILCVGTALAYGNELRREANAIFAPIPHSPPEIEDNPHNPVKLELGKALFFDPRLSKSRSISCNSCHNVGTGGVDNLPKSIGHGGQEGRRNAPTVFNSVFNIALFWDGRARKLREQAKMPIQTAFEMNNTPQDVVATLNSIPGYVEMFSKAFPDEPNPVTFENVGKSLELFQTSLITPDSPFDRYLRGEENAMNPKQLSGLSKFISHGCVTCHRGINVGGNAFFTFGMMRAPKERIRPSGDRGRMEVTGRALHDYTFRVAPLRNVARTAPYFHSGVVWDLHEAVRIMAQSQLNAVLSDEDIDDIVAFLESLTGQQPKIVYPTLPARTAKTPRP